VLRDGPDVHQEQPGVERPDLAGLDPLRQASPNVRSDSEFCRLRVLRQLDAWGERYAMGLQKNARLPRPCELAELALADRYHDRGTKQRMYGSFEYATDGWDKHQRVVARLEHGPQGANPRFIVTNLAGQDRRLYEQRYCARGDRENRIKEAQLGPFGWRAICHRFWANQLRLLLAALAYTLMINLRRHALTGTELANVCTATIPSSCSRLLRPSCATPGVFASSLRQTTLRAKSSPAPRRPWLRRVR
jgi:hypothetical protein